MKDKKLFWVPFKKFPQIDPVKQALCGTFIGFQELRACSGLGHLDTSCGQRPVTAYVLLP